VILVFWVYNAPTLQEEAVMNILRQLWSKAPTASRIVSREVYACVILGASAMLLAQTATPSLQPVPGTGALKPPAGSSFTFIVAGDNRPAKADLPQPATPGQIFAAAKGAGASFIVWTGDTIYGLDDKPSEAINQQYQAFFKLAATAGVPVFTAPGNHEMDVKVKGDKDLKEEGSAAMEALYRKNMGLAPNAQIYGAFTYGNARFILVNTEEVAPATVVRSPAAKTDSGANLDPGYISPAQMQWIAAELASNKATHTFVFMHHPIQPKKADMGLNKKNADDLTKLFAKYGNISYVLASHEHLYYNPQTKDTSPPPNRNAPSTQPPFYLVSGGAGAPLVGTPATGGFHNYLVFHVAGNNVEAQVVKLP
jgi:3',5'-cyclic AMP phosphodiesterase CpdA